MCGGILPKAEFHDGDYNKYRFCIRFNDSDIVDIQCNDSDLDYFRSIFDSLDGKKTSWLTLQESYRQNEQKTYQKNYNTTS